MGVKRGETGRGWTNARKTARGVSHWHHSMALSLPDGSQTELVQGVRLEFGRASHPAALSHPSLSRSHFALSHAHGSSTAAMLLEALGQHCEMRPAWQHHGVHLKPAVPILWPCPVCVQL